MEKIIGVGWGQVNTNVGGTYVRTSLGVTHVALLAHALERFGQAIQDEPGTRVGAAREIAAKLGVPYEGEYRPGDQLGFCTNAASGLR